MLPNIARALVCAVVAGPFIPAQVAVTATAQRIEAMGSTVAPGTVVTGGVSISEPTASVDFDLQSSPGEIRAVLVASTYWGSIRGGRPALSSFAEVDLAYTSAVPIPVSVAVTVSITGGASIWSTGTVHVVGHGVVTAFQPPRVFDAVIDNSGLSVDIDLASLAPATSPFEFSFWSEAVTAEVMVTPRVFASSYGSACGASLSVGASLQSPRHVVTAHDPSGATFGMLYVGAQQIFVPLTVLGLPWSCPLLTDILLALPLSLDATGTASFTVPVLPGSYTMQAFTAAPTTVHTTNGLAFSR